MPPADTSHAAAASPPGRGLTAIGRLRTSLFQAGRAVANAALATGLLYLWGAAYYSGYAGALGVPAGIGDFSTPTLLLASWQGVSGAAVSSLRAWLVILILAGGVWGVAALTLLGYLAVRRMRAGRAPAPKSSGSRDDVPAPEPVPAQPEPTPTKDAVPQPLADLSTRLDVAADEFVYQVGLLVPVMIVLAIGLKTTEQMARLGESAGRLALQRCHPARITRDDSAKLQFAASDRRVRTTGKSAPPPELVEPPLRFCARLGDRLVFLRDSTYVVEDRADVKHLELFGPYPYTAVGSAQGTGAGKASSP